MEKDGLIRTMLPDGFNLNVLPCVEFVNRAHLPVTSGIYFAIDYNDKIWYIGKAQNLRTRWCGHHRDDQLQKINKKNKLKLAWYTCLSDAKTLARLENYFIDRYHPVLNQTKIQAKKITPAEIELRKTLVKMGKYVVIFGYEEHSKEFGLPTVHIKYDCLRRNPVRSLSTIFDAVNKKGGLRWSYYWRVKTAPIWQTKCNGVAIVVSSTDGVTKFMNSGEEVTLAGIPLLNISTEDFQKEVAEKDWAETYHPNIRRYTNDPVPLIWSKDLEINQCSAETLRKLHRERTEPRAYRPCVKPKLVVEPWEELEPMPDGEYRVMTRQFLDVDDVEVEVCTNENGKHFVRHNVYWWIYHRRKNPDPETNCVIVNLQAVVDRLPTIRWSGYRFRFETLVFSEDDVEVESILLPMVMFEDFIKDVANSGGKSTGLLLEQIKSGEYKLKQGAEPPAHLKLCVWLQSNSLSSLLLNPPLT